MGKFDRFAERASAIAARAPFFAFCVALVVGWLALGPFMGWKNDLYHLLLNSPTTAMTFLLVALLNNSQRRADIALQTKLNAIAQGVLDLMEGEPDNFDRDRLRNAVGLEQTVSAKDQAA